MPQQSRVWICGMILVIFIMTVVSSCRAEGITLAGGVTKIVISPEDVEVKVTSSVTLIASGFDEKGKPVQGIDVNWTLSDTSLGEITKLNETYAIFTAGTKAVSPGKLRVKASCGMVTGEANITILPGDTVKITISPGSASVQVKGTVVFTARGVDEFDNVVPGEMYTWNITSMHYGYFRSQHGAKSVFVAGTIAGSTTVSVESCGVKAIATVYVKPGVLTAVRIFPNEVEVDSMDQVTFYPYPVDEYGNRIPGKFNFTWSFTHSFARIANTSGNNVTLSIGEIGGGEETVTVSLGENLTAKAVVKVRPAIWLISTLIIVLLTVVITFLVRFKTRTFCPECGAPHWRFVEKCQVCGSPMVRRPEE